MPPHLPPLLSPYLALPPETSMILLTSVLGASTNWLIQRYLYATLSPQSQNEDTQIILVSFLRDLSFWKENSRKIGLDLPRLLLAKRFAFVDGLSELFAPPAGKGSVRSVDDGALRDSNVQSVAQAILGAVKRLGEGRKVLIIDGLGFLLAAGGQGITAVGLNDLLMELRQHVHSTVLSLAADSPLVQEQHTPLELNHSSLLLSVAHQASLVLGLRLLDTGTARDVSGVIRITKEYEEDLDDGGALEGLEERELLYYVGGDGGVRVFERGQ